MADLIAALGLILIGAVGACAAMVFLGYRHPTEHEERITRMLSRVQSEIALFRSLFDR